MTSCRRCPQAVSRFSGSRSAGSAATGNTSTTQRPASSYNLLTGRTYKDPYTRATWAELTRSLTEEGFREPLKLEYEPDSRRAYLGEGNHRLVAAGLAGYSAVPVWALRGYDSERMRQARRVPGVPELTRDNGRGYFPSSFRPSDVLPRSYLYLGENPQFCNRCTPGIPARQGV